MSSTRPPAILNAPNSISKCVEQHLADHYEGEENYRGDHHAPEGSLAYGLSGFMARDCDEQRDGPYRVYDHEQRYEIVEQAIVEYRTKHPDPQCTPGSSSSHPPPLGFCTGFFWQYGGSQRVP